MSKSLKALRSWTTQNGTDPRQWNPEQRQTYSELSNAAAYETADKAPEGPRRGLYRRSG
ncbi:hypothetical protein [Streptomyces nigrescens]|uniref:hypothetical protein n=1 Tax=Streptomyces nigrescens TaxID=1920 RepID=UPI0037034849